MSLWVFIGAYASLKVLSRLYGRYRSYASFWFFLGLYASLLSPMDTYGSL